MTVKLGHNTGTSTTESVELTWQQTTSNSLQPYATAGYNAEGGGALSSDNQVHILQMGMVNESL